MILSVHAGSTSVIRVLSNALSGSEATGNEGIGKRIALTRIDN
jgi:hypothetical protein